MRVSELCVVEPPVSVSSSVHCATKMAECQIHVARNNKTSSCKLPDIFVRYEPN